MLAASAKVIAAVTKMEPVEQDRLILQTIKALNESYQSPYTTTIDFPIREGLPNEDQAALRDLIHGLKPSGVPDTIAYITEEELTSAAKDLEEIGYDAQSFHIALSAPPAPVDYFHLIFRPR